MLSESINIAMRKAGKNQDQIDAILSGDLLNQLMSSSFSAKDFSVPFLGIYGACSTMAESILLGCVLVDGGYANTVVAAASESLQHCRTPISHASRARKPAPAFSPVDGYGFGKPGNWAIAKSPFLLHIRYRRKNCRYGYDRCESNGGGHGSRSFGYHLQASY